MMECDIYLSLIDYFHSDSNQNRVLNRDVVCSNGTDLGYARIE
jgi:hypothetical protein